LQRSHFIRQITALFKVFPVVALLGPRQCGKTTLAKTYIQLKNKKIPPENHFDLEDTTDLARLAYPKMTLEPLEGLIVIDEIQRRSELFPALRVLVDKKPRLQQYLILGSASRDLIQQSSETLAGRIGYLELTPFSYTEIKNIQRLWMRGGFPRSYLAKNEQESHVWREEYIRTFLERDIPNLGIQVPALQLRRFWMMLGHYHGNLFNASEIGRALGLNHKTIQHYLDILNGTFMMRVLPPWFENISKRQVKTPKIYFRDSGIFHTLLGIAHRSALLTSPKIGASWEGFALEEIIRFHQAKPEECYFWSTHGEAELDLLILKNGKRLGFEFKYTDAPKMTKSMVIAQEDIKLDKLSIIYPGKHRFPVGRNIEAVGLENYL
jgi:predicted AAA+ superfamily ATPase